MDVHKSGDFPLLQLAECYDCLAQDNPAMREEYQRMEQEYRAKALEWEMPEEIP